MDSVTLGYLSKAVILARRNHPTTKWECLSVIWELRTLGTYVEGMDFLVCSDNDGLRCRTILADPHGQLDRCM